MKAETFQSLEFDNHRGVEICLERSTRGIYRICISIDDRKKEIDDFTRLTDSQAVYFFLQRISEKALIALWETK